MSADVFPEAPTWRLSGWTQRQISGCGTTPARQRLLDRVQGLGLPATRLPLRPTTEGNLTPSGKSADAADRGPSASRGPRHRRPKVGAGKRRPFDLSAVIHEAPRHASHVEELGVARPQHKPRFLRSGSRSTAGSSPALLVAAGRRPKPEAESRGGSVSLRIMLCSASVAPPGMGEEEMRVRLRGAAGPKRRVSSPVSGPTTSRSLTATRLSRLSRRAPVEHSAAIGACLIAAMACPVVFNRAGVRGFCLGLSVGSTCDGAGTCG